MKKLFTFITLIMLTALTANAAEKVRRTWDFTKGWSETTLACLEADATHWTKTTNNFESKAFSGTVALMEYNGENVPIPELEGMAVGGCKTAKHVNLYIGAGKNPADIGCLWLNGKKAEDYVEVQVPAGENVKLGYTTHKNGEARGFKTGSAGFADADGGTTWQTSDGEAIAEVVILNSNTETATLKLSATNGAHIYYLIIGEGDVKETAKVGIMYYEAAGKSFEQLPIYAALKDMADATFEGIKVDDGNPTKEKMQEYSVVVLDNSLPNDADLVSFLKSNIYWQPVLNLNAEIAAALGFGTKVEGESEIVIVTDQKKNWFSNFDAIDDQTGAGDMGYASTNGNEFPTPLVLAGNHKQGQAYGVWLNEEFAVSPDSVVAYVYNNGHNEYIYYGVGGDFADGTEVILKNMVADAAASKTDVSETPAPTIKGNYREMESTITLTCLNKNAEIHYTTDGSEPTLDSPVYSDPLVFTTEGNVVKAIALADGYTTSGVSELTVLLYHQAKAPVISYTGGGKDANAVITIESDEDVDIYYNFVGSAATTDVSSLYEGPITITTTATISAFAVGKEGSPLVQSDKVDQQVFANVGKIRRDVIGQFNPGSEAWGTLANLEENGVAKEKWVSSNYYFSWGKTAVKSYEEVGEPLIDPDTGDPMLDENGNFVYDTVERAPEVTTSTVDTNWKLVSQGQVMIYQSNSLTKQVGNGDGYNPGRAEDMILWSYGTASDIQCGGKYSGDVYTARIESTNKYQAPFNVIVVACTSSGSGEQLEVQVSEDGTTWTTVGDRIVLPSVKRLGKAVEVSYDEEKEVYVRVAHVATGSGASIHNIVVLNHGEESAKQEEEQTGVTEVTAEPAPSKPIKIAKEGKLLIETPFGTVNAAGAYVK